MRLVVCQPFLLLCGDVTPEWLPEFAKKSGMPEAKVDELTKSAQKLNDAFDKVHQKIDAGEKPDYAAVSGNIEAEIKTLEGMAAAKE